MQNKIETKGNFALTVISEVDYQYTFGLAMMRSRLRKSAIAKGLHTLVMSFDAETEAFVLADSDGLPNETDGIVREMAHIVRACTMESETSEEFEQAVKDTREFIESTTVVDGGTDSLKARLGSTPSLDKEHQRKALENKQWQMAGDKAVTYLVELVSEGILDIADEPEYVGDYIRRSIDKILDDTTAKVDRIWSGLDKDRRDDAVMGIQYLQAMQKAYC